MLNTQQYLQQGTLQRCQKFCQHCHKRLPHNTGQDSAVVVLLAKHCEGGNGIMCIVSELSVIVATHQRIVSGSFIPALTQHVSFPPKWMSGVIITWIAPFIRSCLAGAIL